LEPTATIESIVERLFCSVENLRKRGSGWLGSSAASPRFLDRLIAARFRPSRERALDG
jgi:hypothetical protein